MACRLVDDLERCKRRSIESRTKIADMEHPDAREIVLDMLAEFEALIARCEELGGKAKGLEATGAIGTSEIDSDSAGRRHKKS
jgi:hypothetical protein